MARYENLKNGKAYDKKQIVEEAEKYMRERNDSFSFEWYCCSCDNFPGDGLYPPGCNASHGETVCPNAEKFKNHEMTGDTEWRRFDCKFFYD